MKRKLFSLLLCLILTASTLYGCGAKKTATTDSEAADPAAAQEQGATSEGEASTAEGEESTAEGEVVADAITTVGPEDGTHLEMWTFVELHSNFYAEMLEQWNKEHPDKQLNITFTTYPYADMHNKLMLANQSGSGAPDLCDIEIGQFPNFLQGEVQFRPMNDVIEPYKKDIVQARLDIYSKDGNYYGVPTHVGATVMYYNTKILEQYGIDYTKIKTWDDYAEAGKQLKEASGGKVYMTSVDTGGTDWLWLAMAEYGEDYTTEDGAPNIELQSIKNMINMQKGWLDEGIAMVSPGGQVDMEEGYANVADGNIVSFPKAMWFMSRFLNYMPEMTDTWAIAPCPVFEEGQPRSVGIGGTGTVVSLQSKNADLAAEFIAWAKLSYDGNVKIWENLGFDTCNTTIWTDETITKDTSNKYIAYFVTNPFDTLNEIKDEIGKIKVGTINPAISEQFNLTILNNCFENGANVDDELKTAQEALEIEY
ncbi:extracellular solute-binding protein [Anaerocolumna sedimenticola]|uniref:Extracellular solute-binding protein n=1 Tax=Anaerocolumna sedimenticola TaxID=2696063 RepID=A0A6P1TI01_9FIRM|nr:extracellular solute-binding protein [Anaerocolumna sedimenticola]QHQ60774.1 extracellular solute-binding protein [Anaerocolumna sedimenticola]